ncbi:hypothetical protein SAMN04487910_4139 [Aquimarina amphilecti]|uniref:Adhesin domain-containing protein n=1 Tax=Aquimarina amphilecti TaxID=1038014 RepID=A0A1H7VQ77_AQUAM|nr:DUF4097 domain-containing protein [Aquimarina amphilecti]SEM11330.1 hypothetical protein SAMN04487910_4139 [Aquimarina amphilecti]
MKDIFYKKLIILVLILFTGHYTNGQEKLSKSIQKIYDFSNAGELQLENKYGNIIINGWDQNKAKVTIDITVSKKDKDDAKDLLGRIQPILNTSDDFLSIFLNIEEKSDSFFSKVFNRVNPFDFDKGNIQIDYHIYLPVNAEIQLTNKFGDIIINDWNGKLKTNLQHGDMWINNEIMNANIELKFGKLHTKSITYGKIELKNSEFDHETSKNLRVISSGSTITIKQVDNLEIYSSKDKVSIETIDEIKGELEFTNIIIEKLKNTINLTMDVADFRVEKILKQNADININQKSSEVNINISELNFDFSASLEQGLLRIPKTFKNIKNKVLDSKKRLRDIRATYGIETNKGTFHITGRKGVIILKE